MIPESASATVGPDRVERLENQYFGKYRGVVIANNDPQHLGRLRVWVPSLFPTDDNQPPSDESPLVTDWAWPCLPFGGAPDQGLFFVPEVLSKVWVEYEEGNLDSPIWVGVFWSAPAGATEIPSEAAAMDADQPQRRVVKTPGGHVLEFCDVAGKEAVTLRHTSGATMLFDEHGSVTIGNKEGTFVYLNAQDSSRSPTRTQQRPPRRQQPHAHECRRHGGRHRQDRGAGDRQNVMLRSDTAFSSAAMEPAFWRTFASSSRTRIDRAGPAVLHCWCRCRCRRRCPAFPSRSP